MAAHLDLEKQLSKSRPGTRDRKDDKWMADIADETPICELNIPGTHDSAAYTYAVPFIATQNLPIAEQLNGGIRYFDLRCGLRNDVLEMVHGPQLLGLTLQDLLGTMYLWLDDHNTEGLVVQLKRDRDDEASSTSFVTAVVDLLDNGKAYWRTSNTTPSIGQLRGKIQLLRRFRGEGLSAYGLNVSRWQDNPKKLFTMNVGHKIHVTVQDHYRYDDPLPLPEVIAQKNKEINEGLVEASLGQDTHHWYINFTSALELNWSYQYAPRQIALGGLYRFRRVVGVNDVLKERLEALEDHVKLGIVAMDFPNLSDGLIRALIDSNFMPVEQHSKDGRGHAGSLIVLLMCSVAFLITYQRQSILPYTT